MTLYDYALYAVLVGIWGGSFIAIEFQLGVVANEVSILWRYLMAAIVMTAICLTAKRRMHGFSLADHL
ncbi:EamA family transporter, partial [bacterium]|nr:EamA family transporter [bacterium]